MTRKKAYVPPVQSHLPTDDYRRNLDETFAGERTVSTAYAYEHALPGETIAEAKARLQREARAS